MYYIYEKNKVIGIVVGLVVKDEIPFGLSFSSF